VEGLTSLKYAVLGTAKPGNEVPIRLPIKPVVREHSGERAHLRHHVVRKDR
jgi:hypothetical protein